jgi:peptidylprolyl isomerase
MILGTIVAVILVFSAVACSTTDSTEESPTATTEISDVSAQEGSTNSTIEETSSDTSTELSSEEQGSSTAISSETDTGEEVIASPETGDFDPFAGANEDEIVTTESGLQYVVLTEGAGEMPNNGEVVSVHYTGWLLDGTQFDTSTDREVPFTFALGQGMVIAGWDEGIGLIKVGGRGRLIIPSELGYGSAGAGELIPPDATLVFEVELVDILPGVPEAPTAVDESDYIVSESGLKYFDFVEGAGPSLKADQQAVVHYTGWTEDGTIIDSSLTRGQPAVFIVGVGQIIPGWDEGLLSMKAGGKRQLVIPPELAYGETGAGGGLVPPNATLIFEIELIEFR